MTDDRFTRDKATIRAELEKRARAGETITYGEAAALVGRANQGSAPSSTRSRRRKPRTAGPISAASW